MRSTTALAVLLAGCSCPRPLCTQWLVVELASEHWDVGSYEVTLDLGERQATCTLPVPSQGDAPAPSDITCSPGVLADTRLLDTAELFDPERVELRWHTGEGPDVPKDLVLTVTWQGSGVSAPLVRLDTAIDWDARPPPYGTCASGCFTAALDVEVPAASVAP